MVKSTTIFIILTIIEPLLSILSAYLLLLFLTLPGILLLPIRFLSTLVVSLMKSHLVIIYIITLMSGVIIRAHLRCWVLIILIAFLDIQILCTFDRYSRWIKVKSLRRELLFSLIVEYFLREIKDTIPVRRLCHRLCLLCRVCLVLRSRRLKV